MRRAAFFVLALTPLLGPVPVSAEETAGPVLTQPLPVAPVTPPAPVATPGAPVPEETPAVPSAVRPPPPAVAQPAPVLPPPPAATPVDPVRPPAAEPVAMPDPAPAPVLPLLVQAVLPVVGGLIAGLIGWGLTTRMQEREQARRRRAAAATLAIELDARRQAFEAVPAPPNAEAGVSFVSAVAALAEVDYGWRAVQADLTLLPDRMAASLSVHYAAVHRVAGFVKGQSFAAALRMLQANRIGGHPCPDAGAMREAHVELAAAFRGIDKLIQGLRGVS